MKLICILIMAYLIPLSLSASVAYIDSAEKFNKIPTIQVDAFTYLKSAEKAAKKVRFIFVRHGQTHTNARGGLPGSRTSNDSLTAEGEGQAAACGERLAATGIAFDAFYLSPTVRTQETLDKLGAKFTVKAKPEKDERLHEKYHGRYENYGSLTGDLLEQLKAENGSIKAKEIKENTGFSKTFEEKFNYSPDPLEIESLAKIYARVSSFLTETYAKHQSGGQNCLVISHYGVLKTLFMQDAFKRGFDVDYRSHDMKNCGVVVVEVDDTGIHIVATHGLTFTGKS